MIFSMLFIEILFGLMLGVIFGIITGLTPGIHINLVAATLLSLSPSLLLYSSTLALSVFIISMSVVHSFLDSIPSIFLGAPDSATALGVLPGHRYLIRGYGLMAVKLTIIGSFGALLLSIILYPILYFVVEHIYILIQNIIVYILIAVVIFMILRDNKKLWAIYVFLLSGALGSIVLSFPNLKNPLFPMLSGLFGIATLFISIKDSNNIPSQKQSQNIKLNLKQTIKAVLSGQFSGFLTAILPGIGSATAAVISLQITRDLKDKGFMILMGAIGTANFILSMLTLQILGKARNGSIVVVKELIFVVDWLVIVIFLLVTLISGGFAVFLALKIGRLFSRYITKISYKKLVFFIISMIIILTFILSGWVGIIVLFVSTCIGLIPAIVKVTRVHTMGCLLFPVIMFFLL